MVTLGAVQCLDVGEDVIAGHFPQVVVAVRPFQQGRAASVEVEPDRAVLGPRPGFGHLLDLVRSPKRVRVVRYASHLVDSPAATR